MNKLVRIRQNTPPNHPIPARFTHGMFPHQRLGDPLAVRDANPERQLWSSVLLAMVRDLIKSNRSDRTDAERWVGTYQSSDFREVVTLAGLDSDAVHSRLRRICAIPQSERHLYIPNDLFLAGHFQ